MMTAHWVHVPSTAPIFYLKTFLFYFNNFDNENKEKGLAKSKRVVHACMISNIMQK